jgi:hypothetical protein
VTTRRYPIRLRLGREEIELPPDLAARLTPLVPAADPPLAGEGGGEAARRDRARAVVAGARPRPGDRILLVVPDRTRALALAPLLDALGAALGEAGIGAGDATVAIASGSHDAAADDASPARLGAWARQARLLAHRPAEATAAVGRSPAGTEVLVHPALLAAPAVIAVGGTAFHYFAGFGGGAKLLFPGLGGRASIAANHRRSLAPWPPGGLAAGVEPGRLEGNPVAEDLAAIAELLPAAAHWTVWDGEAAGVAWTRRAEFVALAGRYARGRRVGHARSYDAVVASAGGHPRDVDLVQAHKALYHAALFARDGAAIVLFAECAEGVGSRALEVWLAVAGRERREQQARADYDLNAQTAVSLAAIAARCRVTWVGAGPAALDGLGIARRTDAVAAVREALAGREGGVVLPVATAVVPAPLDGAHTAPYTPAR